MIISSHVLILDEARRKELESKVRELATSPASDLQNFLREFLQQGVAHNGDTELLRAELNKTLPLENTVLVDATGLSGAGAIHIHQNGLADGHRIITANKNPLSLGSFEDFCELTKDKGKYFYSPTVMAGGGVIGWLQQAVAIGERPTRIEGCFSGTLGYIATELEKSSLEKGGRTFSAIVRDAQAQKITEPHPWSDLSGLDVAMAERMNKAKAGGNTLRYVAEITQGGVTVGLKEVPADSPLGRAAGTLNIVTFTGGALAPAAAPHTIVSKGAGVERTAASLRVDLLGLSC